MDNHQIAHDELMKFMQLSEARRDSLLKDFSFNISFMNGIIKGFISLEEKYNEILITAAGMHNGLMASNKEITTGQELLGDTSSALSEFVTEMESEGADPTLVELFQKIINAADSIKEGLGYVVKRSNVHADGFFRNLETGEDRAYAPEARGALAFFIAQLGESLPVEDDSDIDEDALKAALEGWTKEFKEKK